MNRPDLGNRSLPGRVFGAVVLLVLYFAVVQPALPRAWRVPGSPPLYPLGAAGAALLLASFVFVLVQRTGRGGSPPAWFVAHVMARSLGAVPVAIHSAGFLSRPPAPPFLALFGLAALGPWGRGRAWRP